MINWERWRPTGEEVEEAGRVEGEGLSSGKESRTRRRASISRRGGGGLLGYLASAGRPSLLPLPLPLRDVTSREKQNPNSSK